MLGKALGALLVIGACTAVGWQMAANLTRRPRELRALQAALAILATEVTYGASPLPEALRRSAAAAGGPVGRLLIRTADLLVGGGGITAGDAMQQAVREVEPTTALRQPELEALAALGAVLGASDRRDQARHLELARTRIASEEGRAAEERTRYERLYRYAGLLAGVALVLVLL